MVTDMFLRTSWRGYVSNEQRVKGPYLLVFQPDFAEPEYYPNGKLELLAAVRTVTLKQLGHWMMGIARIAGERISVSGDYGNDGLPMHFQECPSSYRDRLVLVPEGLATQFWESGGHNCAGNERTAMREWAIENEALLRGKGTTISGPTTS
jgi:hypothetical protein